MREAWDPFTEPLPATGSLMYDTFIFVRSSDGAAFMEEPTGGQWSMREARIHGYGAHADVDALAGTRAPDDGSSSARRSGPAKCSIEVG